MKKNALRIRNGGLLIIRALWSAQFTYFDMAVNDFYIHSGRKKSSRDFKEVYRFDFNNNSCFYRKKLGVFG